LVPSEKARHIPVALMSANGVMRASLPAAIYLGERVATAERKAIRPPHHAGPF
jgi:hypothetical protein